MNVNVACFAAVVGVSATVSLLKFSQTSTLFSVFNLFWTHSGRAGMISISLLQLTKIYPCFHIFMSEFFKPIRARIH